MESWIFQGLLGCPRRLEAVWGHMAVWMALDAPGGCMKFCEGGIDHGNGWAGKYGWWDVRLGRKGWHWWPGFITAAFGRASSLSNDLLAWWIAMLPGLWASLSKRFILRLTTSYCVIRRDTVWCWSGKLWLGPCLHHTSTIFPTFSF